MNNEHVVVSRRTIQLLKGLFQRAACMDGFCQDARAYQLVHSSDWDAYYELATVLKANPIRSKESEAE